MTVFTNCYKYNPPDLSVYEMAQSIERILLNKLERLSSPVSYFFQDIKQVWDNCYKYNAPTEDVSYMCKNVENAFNEKIRKLPSEVLFLSQA